MRTLYPATSASDSSMSRIVEKVPHLITCSGHPAGSALFPFLQSLLALGIFSEIGFLWSTVHVHTAPSAVLESSPEVSLSGHSVSDSVWCGSGKGRATILSNTSWIPYGVRGKLGKIGS